MRFHESVLGVYFDDLDMFGILHNARYLLFMERTIGEFWKKLGWGGFDAKAGRGEDHPDQFHLVRLNHIEYLRPVVGVCEVRVRLSVARIGRTSLSFSFRLMPLDEDVDYAVGERVVVCVDPETRKPAPWSQTFRDKLAPYC